MTIFNTIQKYDPHFLGFKPLLKRLAEFDAEMPNTGYPPYNIIQDGEKYFVELAVAGFSECEIEIISLQNILYIKGKKVQNNSQNIIHKGIALRPFEKKFNLDPLMEVTEAILSQGLLNIKLFKREPEIIKPKRIEIKTT